MMRVVRPLIGVGAMAMVLAGCGGAKEAADTTTIINQTVIQSSAAASPGASAGGSASPAPATAQPAGMPQPPAGASQIESGTEHGMAKVKYSISGQLPNQVVDYYTNLWKNDGYTIINAASGSDGGRHGGATAVASKNGTFVGVDADADPGEPTHFKVCQGSDEMAVRDCID